MMDDVLELRVECDCLHELFARFLNQREKRWLVPFIGLAGLGEKE